jgi:hypothetical protein
MTPDIIEAHATKDFELLLTFANGERRKFSMQPNLQYPAYRALLQPSKFAQVYVSNGTVAWDDEIDMSPDTLYLLSQPAVQPIICQQGMPKLFSAGNGPP